MNDYNKCCKEYMEKNYNKYTTISTDICPICKRPVKPWWYINKEK
jgi:hypothetical protein